jgi:hypothetical protein
VTSPHIDASLRDFQLIVGSTDISDLVVSGSLGREQPDQETPAYWRGQVTLAGVVIGSSLDLDPRTNPLWLRYANTVILRIADSNGTLRDVARLLISLATYDDWPTAKFLDLELVDNLGRESFSRSFDFGTYSARSILQQLGIPVGLSVPGRLAPIDSGFDNPIGLAQSLAWSSGLLDGGDPYILHTDAAGDVQAIRKGSLTTFRRGDREVLSFSQFPPSEEIASQVITSSTWRYTEEVPAEEINTNPIIEIEQDGGGKIISRQTTRFNNDGTLRSELSEILESEIYPDGSNFLRNSLEITYSYSYDTQDRLTRKSTFTRIPRYAIDEDAQSPSSLTDGSEIIESYRYSDDRVSQVVTTSLPQGIILPGSQNPFSFRFAAQEVTTVWRKVGSAWSQSIRVQRMRALSDATLSGPFLRQVASTQSISPSSPPPPPQIRPRPLSAQRTIVEETVQGSCEVAVLGQIPATRITNVTLQLGIGENELSAPVEETRELVQGSLNRAACYIADEIAGRAYARRIEMPLPDEWLLNPRPLIRVDIRDERHHIYGETITWGSGTTRFEAIGVLVGKVATVPNPPDPVLPALTPAATPTGFELVITDIANINYPIGIPITSLSWQAFGGTPPYTFDVSAGSLPPGLTLSSSGILTGTPTTEGSYSFTVRVIDDDADTATDGILIGVESVAATIPVFGELPQLSGLIGYMPQLRDPGFTLLAEPMDPLLGYVLRMPAPEILTELRAAFGYMVVLDRIPEPDPPEPGKYEAEDATLNSGTIQSRSNASGGFTVRDIVSGDSDNGIIFSVDFDSGGDFDISLAYSAIEDGFFAIRIIDGITDPQEFVFCSSTSDRNSFSSETVTFFGVGSGFINVSVFADSEQASEDIEIDFIQVTQID